MERSRRYDNRYGRDNRFGGMHERNRGGDEFSHGYRDSDCMRMGNNGPRRKKPLLQFTTDINPACFSGPIPFSLMGEPQGPPNLFHDVDPFVGGSGSNDFNMEHRPSRRKASIHDSPEEDRRHRRHRDRRERERSRDRPRERKKERERERGREHERDRSQDKTVEKVERDRERDRGRGRDRDYWDEIPNNTIMVRSLKSSITEADLRGEVVKYGLQPKDIRLIREKDTGASRGFAFVEFSLLSEAVRWKELTKSVIFVDGQHRSTLHYSIPKDAAGAEKVLLSRADWDCIKCGTSNFKRRDYCFQCNCPREDSRAAEGFNEISSPPSNTLLFRNLDVSTTEGRVLAMLGQLTTLPIKSLRVAKDAVTNTSRGFAFVELHSTSEATQLHDLLLSMSGNFYVDGRQVTVSYAKRSLTSMNSAASANAAIVALAAAQWSNQESDKFSSGDYNALNSTAGGVSTQESSQVVTGAMRTAVLPDLGTVVVQGVTYKKYPLPDISTYQYDESSGYYYDATTGLYYDAASQYYYNSETQQYMYWDSEQQTYLPATQSVSSSADPVTQPSVPSSVDVSENDNQEKVKNKKEEKLDKVKIAKKIAKDMERWAKTLNQKKENAKLGIVTNPVAEPIFAVPSIIPRHSAAADAGFAVLEQKTSLSERSILLADVSVSKSHSSKHSSPSKADPNSLLLVASSYGDDSESESEEEISQVVVKQNKSNVIDESKFTDWNKLACLLCKRQFPSKEVLVKHQQLSDLHKKNLQKLSSGEKI